MGHSYTAGNMLFIGYLTCLTAYVWAVLLFLFKSLFRIKPVWLWKSFGYATSIGALLITLQHDAMAKVALGMPKDWVLPTVSAAMILLWTVLMVRYNRTNSNQITGDNLEQSFK